MIRKSDKESKEKRFFMRYNLGRKKSLLNFL
jgi:hypothetical protein